jgi:hypothetical protein
MAREVAPPEKQAEILRDQGNLYFKKERLGAAIEAYTEVRLPCTASFTPLFFLWVCFIAKYCNA